MALASAPAAPESLPPPPRNFAPVHSCGGLVAAVGLLLFSAAGLFTTLPGFPVAASYPVWLLWTLRLAPLPVLLLLWAVAHEAEFRVRVDASAIHFRQVLGAGARVPWRALTDYFADCGRSPQAVAASGGSMTHNAADLASSPARPPFASYRPDYTLVSDRGTLVFDDGLADVNVLAGEVSSHAPEDTPDTWEEASWLTCRRCDERAAVSLWPLPSGDQARYCNRCRAPTALRVEASPPAACDCGGEFVQEEFTCPACGEPYGEALPSSEQGLIVERRGSMKHPRPWSAFPAEPPPGSPLSPTGGEEDDEST